MSAQFPAPNRRDFLATSATALLAASSGGSALRFVGPRP